MIEGAVAIIDYKNIGSTSVVWVTHELTTLGNEKVCVTVAVEITPYRAIVATVVIAAGFRIEDHIHQGSSIGKLSAPVIEQNDVVAIIVASKSVKISIVIDVNQIASLHENARPGIIN